MIRYQSTILLLTVFILFSCKDEFSIDVDSVIQKYHLNYQTSPMRSTLDNSLHGDGLLFATIHYNKVTDSCLYVLKNYKKDTLLVHLDKGIGNYYHSQIMKQKNNYFFLLRDFGKMKSKDIYPDLSSTPNIPDSYKMNEIVKVFEIDTIQRKMTQIKRTPDLEIVKSIKRHFDLEGDFYMIHSPFEGIARFDYSKINTLITIAKDTLDNYQSYYQVNMTFEPQKRGKSFELSPNFNEINYLGKFKENIGYWEGSIGNTKEVSIKYKYYYYYLHPNDSTYFDYKKLNKIEIISHFGNKENIISTLKEENIFKLDSKDEIGYNVGLISEFRPEMFRYYNGEYFITTFLPKQDEYIESVPPIYHLDTIEWRLNKVELFDPLVDKKYSNLQRKVSIDMTGNFRDSSLFLESFEIVKVNNEYRLIKKGI